MPARIGRLVSGERFCVLSTQGAGQPYASLLAHACSADLKQIVFATPVTTRKFALLQACHEVAALVDSRARSADLMTIEAVTALGTATQLSPGSETHAQAVALYLLKHPQLASFLRSPSCALFALHVERYLLVSRFQDVREWQP